MVKLLIFDLDGTLADTGRDIANALNYALSPFGAREYSVEETKAMVGSGISSLLQSLLPPEANSPDAEGEVTRRFLDFYAEHLMANTYAYPHVRETLAQLADYTKVVLTNKRTKYSREIVEKLGISQHFDLIWGSDSVREKKPSPVPILDFLDHYSVAKENAVMIGDSNFDVQAGRAAGIKVVAVTYGFRPRESLLEADNIIDSFYDLLKVIPRI